MYALYDRDKDFILELISPKLVEEMASKFKTVDQFLNELDAEMRRKFARTIEKAFLFEVILFLISLLCSLFFVFFLSLYLTKIRSSQIVESGTI